MNKIIAFTIIASAFSTQAIASSSSVVGINGTSNVGSSNPSLESKETVVIYDDKIGPKVVGGTLFTENETEKLILKARKLIEGAREGIKQMAFARAHPIDGEIKNNNIGAIKHISDHISAMQMMMGNDHKLLSEKDPVAMAALEKEKKALEDQLAAVQKTIPIADTGYELPKGIDISVIGTSRIQAYPLMDGDTQIGHFRVGCSGVLNEDIIVNQKSVNYCVSSLYINGSPRVTDVKHHNKERVGMYYVGVSDAYVAGHNSKVTINWMNHPKISVVGTLKHYNMDKLPAMVDTLMYNNSVTLSDGTTYPGKNPMVK